MNLIKNFIAGAIIGVANIIPGVSGGTMMVILNVFDKIVGAIGQFTKAIKKNLLYLLPILLGAAAGILAFSKGITFMLDHYPMITNFFFIGLIVGSVPLVCRSAFQKTGGKIELKQIRPVSAIAFVLMLALLIVVAFFSPEEASVSVSEVSVDFPMILKLFFGGILSAVAMIIPGLSGSFIMVLLGVYPLITGAVAVLLPFHMDTFLHTVLPIGLPMGIGIILGLLLGAKLIDVLIKKFPQETYFGILGLLLGSLFGLYPGFAFDWQGAAAILVLLFGFALAYFSSSEWLKNKFVKNGR
ncbi:MAG: DUF368 domain-containing protein [Oscillospiraceae bacterium]|nr:DUF368 domain-containing protein [Oscillospiraceae bacterium]